jgi:phage shock protein A
MGIFQRTSDIISANVNDLIERFENPEKMLRHALRDVEQSVSTVSAAVARSIAAERILASERDRYEAQAAYWQAKAAKSVEAGDEPSARRALARRLEYEERCRALDRQLAEARTTNSGLRRQVEILRDKQTTARRQLTSLMARQAVADANRRCRGVVPSAHAAIAALSRFEHFQSQIELNEAESIALAELEQSTETLDGAEFDREERHEQIEAELAALRAK